jgi:hypothetical protein
VKNYFTQTKLEPTARGNKTLRTFKVYEYC